MTNALFEDRDAQNHQLVRYFHDCLAAQANWARAINVVEQKDVLLLPLAASEQQRFGESGQLRLNDPDAIELAKSYAIGGADRSLFLGALFVVGSVRSPDRETEKRFCGPLLEVALSLQTEGDGEVIILPEEVEFTVNYSLVGELLDGTEEDLQDRLTDLADLVPDFPIDAGEFDDFWKGFRMIAPEIRFAPEPPLPRKRSAHPNRIEELGLSCDYKSQAKSEGRLKLTDFFLPQIASEETFRLLPATAIVLGKKAGRAMSALSELRAMEQMALHRTAFGCVFDPQASRPPDLVPPQRLYPGDVQPLPLTPTQAAIVESSRSAPLTVVTGPPGTGKSYTITAIVLDALLNGQSVLVASQMDKAVEVVADQVERVAGSLAIARSGGRAAQRKLAKKIARLTGPASRLDDISESTIKDCARRHFDLTKQLQQFEQTFRDAVEAERRWSRLSLAADRHEPLLSLPAADVPSSSVRTASELFERAGRHRGTDVGALKRWWAAWDLWRVRRLLQLPSTDLGTPEELESLLQFQQVRAEMRELERQLKHPFPADLIWDEIARLEKSQHETAIELLRLIRHQRVRTLVANRDQRSALRDLVTLLRRRKHEIKQRLQQRLSSELLLEAFPSWACTSRSLCEILPASPGLFDLVVIDEASQCDLALASVALMRGKRAVVVGDPHQLRHVCFLSRAREQASFVRHQFNPEMQHRFHFRRSLFDVAADAVEQHRFFFLDEHFRSHPQIIQFSNRRFYENALQIMTGRPSRNPQSAIRVVTVEGQREDDSSVNPAEVDEVLRTVRSVTDQSDITVAPSIGIVSPFRDQADRIRECLLSEYSSEQLARYQLVVGTAHALQGDEKDIVILSTSIDPQAHPASLRFLESPHLFNVAVTRARRELVVVTSMSRQTLPTGLLREFLFHAAEPWSPPAPSAGVECQIIQAFVDRLSSEQIHVFRGFPTAGTSIPVVALGSADAMGVLCDRHHDKNPSIWLELEAHRRLSRAGWALSRIPHRTLRLDADKCVELIKKQAGSLS